MDDASIRAIVARLARPHPSGGKVIERAAIVAEGDSATEVVDWIIGRAGRGEAAGPARAGGLHGARFLRERSGRTAHRCATSCRPACSTDFPDPVSQLNGT